MMKLSVILFFFMFDITKAADNSSSVDVEEPENAPIICGRYHGSPHFYLEIDGEKVQPYFLNVTADKLRKKGYEITVVDFWDDAIFKMNYTKNNVTKQMNAEAFGGYAAIGGRPALRVRAYYMALIGTRKGDNVTDTRWFCDGVLINSQWILSAAHCFIDPRIEANVVRLGEYDWSKKEDDELPLYREPIDYGIKQIIFHPEFNKAKRYHDVVLMELSRQIPAHSARIVPICLPWGNKTNLNITNFNVTLTGWGATSFNKLNSQEKPKILQEVDLKVYEPSVCEAAYKKLGGFKRKWNKGMTADDIICAGWDEGGKDACEGDSGGPLVYQENDEHDIFLAGIVSGGYGCGLKQFPGIYIPMNRNKYLQWIKKTAFPVQVTTLLI